MEEFKGTKEDLGVWKYSNDLIVTTPAGGHICRLTLSEHSDKWHEYTYANAFMISAAPQMLEALQAVISVADRDTDGFEKARAAVEKALGGHSINIPR